MEQHLTWTRTDSGFTSTIPEGWGQGRATYGGLLGAAVCRNLRRLAPERGLRELQIGFVGPAGPGPARLDAELLRAGRSATHLAGRLHTDRLALTAHLVLGEARASRIEVPAAAPRPHGDPGEGAPFGFVQGMHPDFTQHFDYRWTEGDWPFSGSTRSTIGGWCRFQVDEPMTDEHVVALVDAWPAPVLQMAPGFAPASSITWSLVRGPAPLPERASDWCFYEAESDFARDGVAECRARLYAADGGLLAISRQLVAVFA